MSKRDGGTEATIRKWIRQGDGRGEGVEYRSGLKVRDVPSKGRSRMLAGLKSFHIHHLLSDLEYWHLLLAEHDPEVEAIRDQYVLDWNETQEIAEKLGFKHPEYPKFRTPILMTSDLVLTMKDSAESKFNVISVKPSCDVAVFEPIQNKSDPPSRTVQKLLIEKMYWERRNIPWKLSTEVHISWTKAMNLDMFRTTMMDRHLEYFMPKMKVFLNSFLSHWSHYTVLNDILRAVSVDVQESVQICFGLLGRAVWLHLLPIDLEGELIAHQYPVRMINN